MPNFSVRLIDAPSVVAIINGYTPFTPDGGIFCGGYQGPLYPNPTTLISPKTKFNPYDYMGGNGNMPTVTSRSLPNTGDRYRGLGKGNPGIRYKNPGHILGVIDTYCRMSYGLGFYKLLRLGQASYSFAPLIDVQIPFKVLNNNGSLDNKTIGMAELYPYFSPSPNSWLFAYVPNIFYNTKTTFNPRTFEPFVFDGSGPETGGSSISFEALFGGVYIRSYFDTIPYFRALFEEMATLIAGIYNFNTFEEGLVDDETGPWALEGTLVADLPCPAKPIEGSPWHESSINPTLGTLNAHPEGTDYGEWAYPISPFHYYNACKTLSAPEALLLLTGSPDYHENRPGTPSANYEYRSLTELNAVVNLLPIQTNSFLYSFGAKWDSVPPSLLPFAESTPITAATQVVYSICDICFTTFVPGSITISVNAEIENYVRRWFMAASLGGGQETFFANSERRFIFSTSVTNNFGWDRDWFGVQGESVNTVWAAEGVFTAGERLGEQEDIQTTTTFKDLSKFESVANLTIPEGGGSRTVRARLILQSKTMGGWKPTEDVYLLFGPFDHETLKMFITIDIGHFGTMTHNVHIPLRLDRYYDVEGLPPTE
jgi:hypothetical protein